MSAYWIDHLSRNFIKWREEQKIEKIQSHKEKIDNILSLYTIPDSFINPLFKEDCQLLKWIPVLQEKISNWVDEIILKTNSSWILWDEEIWGIKSIAYRSSSYEHEQKSTFEKRHLAVTYKMKGSSHWQAFTQEEVKRIFSETSYGIFFPIKDGQCQYKSALNQWDSIDLIWISNSPSEELTKNLNDSKISPIIRRTIWR